MKRLALALLLGLTIPALAEGPGERLVFGLLAYIVYGFVVLCLLGWSFLVTVLVRPRVELTARVLQKRPLASFFMGLLSLGWLFLALVIGDKSGGLGVILVVATFSILILCALVGLPAILVGLGRRASALWERKMSLPLEIVLGGGILFAAGGFPWLGQIMLLGLLIWSSGGAVLGFFAGDGKRSAETVVEEG